MKKSVKQLMLVAIFMYGCTSPAGELNVKPGMWEWSTTMEMVGLPFTPPPMVYSSCVTEEDFIPQQSMDNKKCKMLENIVTSDSVEWKVECNNEGIKSVSTGKIVYSSTTAKGEIKVLTQGMEMISKITGKRTGNCK